MGTHFIVEQNQDVVDHLEWVKNDLIEQMASSSDASEWAGIGEQFAETVESLKLAELHLERAKANHYKARRFVEALTLPIYKMTHDWEAYEAICEDEAMTYEQQAEAIAKLRGFSPQERLALMMRGR